MTLAACDDYEDQFNLDSQITDVKKGTAIVLTDADYANIAGLAANKTLAAKLDAESGTNAYTEALAKLPSQKYFNTLITPDQFLPAFIASNYKEADAGSKFKVTYNMYTGKSEFLSTFAILMASMAHSSPLLPSLPPQRSLACCKSLVVSKP